MSGLPAAGGSHLARRALLIAVASVALTAVLAGLARVGWAVPLGASHGMAHGPLFVLGVFGTVIALERAVAHGSRWGYAAPTAGALGAILTVAGAARAGASFALLAAVALAALNAAIVRRQTAPFTWLMLLGSGALVLGCAAWLLGRSVPQVVPAWIVFFVLTILAERLELSRLTPTPRWATRALIALSGMLALAAALLLLRPESSPRPLGVMLALTAGWELRFDLARRTVRGAGLPRYAALGVLLGALWLLVGGGLLAALGLPPSGPRYDAVVHALLVGFVLSMVFAHAPIILPAVAGVAVPYHRALYLPLALLHVGLFVRIAGDVTGAFALRRAGALMNALALAALFLAVLWARSRAAKRGE